MSVAAQQRPTSLTLSTLPDAVRSRIRAKHVKFVLIGIYNTLFGYAVFAALHVGLPHLNYMFVLVVSRELSVVSAFIAYRILVFKVKGALLLDFVRFWMVYSGALVVNLVALPFLVEVVGISVLLAQAITIVGMVISTWIGHNYFSFKRDQVEPESEPVLDSARPAWLAPFTPTSPCGHISLTERQKDSPGPRRAAKRNH